MSLAKSQKTGSSSNAWKNAGGKARHWEN